MYKYGQEIKLNSENDDFFNQDFINEFLSIISLALKILRLGHLFILNFTIIITSKKY